MFALPREIPGKLIGSTVSPGIMMMTKISDEIDVDYLTNRKNFIKSCFKPMRNQPRMPY